MMITPGGQPFFLPGGPFGCLLIHCFTCSPKEVRWLANPLNEAGFSVLAIRLFGHATQPQDLQRARFRDWIANVEDGFTLLKQRCEECILIGISSGGALALIAGAKVHPGGIVAIDTPYSMPGSSHTKLSKTILWLMQLIAMRKRSMIAYPFSHEFDPIFSRDRLSYPALPPRMLLEVHALQAEMQRNLRRVTAPTLLITGEAVEQNARTDAAQILEHLSARRTNIVKIKPASTGDGQSLGQERISAAIIQFITSLPVSRP